MQACITTMRASQRSPATPATTRSPTSGGPSSCYRGSARTRAETTTSPPYATTRGSSRLFAERVGLDLRRAQTNVCPACRYRRVTLPNADADDAAPPRKRKPRLCDVEATLLEWRTTFSTSYGG